MTNFRKSVKKFQPKCVSNLLAKKRRLWKQCKADPNEDNKFNYKQCAAKTKQSANNFRINNEKKIIESQNLGRAEFRVMGP